MHYFDFHYSWEQRKLSEIATMHARIGWQNLRTSEFLDSGDYMLITGTDFIDGAVNFDTCHYVERERYEQDKHIQIRNGSILITKDGTLGKVAYIQGLTMPATLNAGVFNVEIKDENEVDNRYLFQYLKAPFLMDYVDKKATGGTIKHLNQNILVDFPVVLPHKAEQEKIGEYFLAIDHLITLHQREFAFLCKEKSKKFRYIKNAWEQRKFSDLVQIERGGSPRPIDDFITDSPDGLNWVKIGDAPAQGNYITKTAEKIKPEGLSKTREVHPGDLILSNSMSFGKPYIMGIDGCIHDGWLLIRNTYKVFDLTFLCHLLGTPQMIIQYKSLAAGSTVNNLNKELVGNTVVTIPTIKEQRVLGQYLETLDNLITLHQRKYDKLTNVKKSMLEKMFPQNGSNVPEIRFKGFTEAWEQRKAIDIADYSKGNGYSKGDLTDAGTPIILYGRLYTKYQFAISEVDTFAVPRNGAVYSQGNEVIVPASGETAEDIARASAVEKSGVLLGGDLNILRPFDFINPLFLALAISNGEPQKELAKKAQGKSVVHIHNTDIQEVTIAYPSRTEQDRIVSVFRQLDNLITLHQRKPVVVNSSSTMNALPNQHLYFQVLE